MDLSKLKEQFLVEDDVKAERLGQLIQKLLPHCVVGKNGRVELKSTDLSAKQQVKLLLAARLVASKLEPSVSGEVSAEEISEYTGLPKNQAIARARDCIGDKFAERAARGSYRARQHKIESFLSELPQAQNTRSGS